MLSDFKQVRLMGCNQHSLVVTGPGASAVPRGGSRLRLRVLAGSTRFRRCTPKPGERRSSHNDTNSQSVSQCILGPFHNQSASHTHCHTHTHTPTHQHLKIVSSLNSHRLQVSAHHDHHRPDRPLAATLSTLTPTTHEHLIMNEG
jgi:hypothetical protein